MSKQEITKDMTIGHIREINPRANEVLTKFFGPGCFKCPNANTKSIEFGATMHGQDVNKVVKELNEIME